jgi:hypothetical protein
VGISHVMILVNQTMADLLTHEWYCLAFGDKYPKSRKANFSVLKRPQFITNSKVYSV